MNIKEQRAIANLYVESVGGWPRNVNATTFDDDLYTNIRDLMSDMKGYSLQEVVDELSNKLDVRYQNLDKSLQDRIIELYKRLNPYND